MVYIQSKHREDAIRLPQVFHSLAYVKLLPTSANLGRIYTIVILNIWFDYLFRLFDYRVKWNNFVVAVERWLLPSETISVTWNKILGITNNQM